MHPPGAPLPAARAHRARPSARLPRAGCCRPRAILVCSVVAVSLDAAYADAALLWCSSALVLALPFFVMTFNRAYTFKEPDERRRLQKWAWVATPAVASIALAALDGATQGERPGAVTRALSGCPACRLCRRPPACTPPIWTPRLAPDAVPPVAGAAATFSFAARALYLAALGLALMLAMLFVTEHSARVRFDMSSWALAFPLEALAIATQWYAAAVPGRLTTGMALAGLAVASGAVATLSLHTLHALLMGGVFVPVRAGWLGWRRRGVPGSWLGCARLCPCLRAGPGQAAGRPLRDALAAASPAAAPQEAKFTPLAVQQLTHEAFRAAGAKLKTAAAALGLNRKGAVNGAPLADFALQVGMQAAGPGRRAWAWTGRGRAFEG